MGSDWARAERAVGPPVRVVGVARRVLFLGATKGIGRALARRLVQRGDQLFLAGRDTDDLRASAADLEAYADGAHPVGFAALDLDRPETFAPAIDAADAALERFDTVVVTAARFATQGALSTDLPMAQRLLAANFTNTVLFCEMVRIRMMARGGGTLCVFSSVAGDRGRGAVLLYGAAKAGLSTYLEGLDHAFRKKGLVTVCVKPGFVRTGMTAGLPEPPFAGSADEVAARALKAIDRGWPVVYAPPIWALVMLIIRQLPRAIMRRVSF